MKALLLIDLQNDFLPDGSLPIRNGDEVISVANRLMEAGDYDLIVATQDWHPQNHGSFASQHEGKNPFDMGELDGLPQVMWPDHCVQNTYGAQLASALNTEPIDQICTKGQDQNVDSYSAFYDNAKRNSTRLGDWLKERKIDELHVMGLATDYCVKFSVLDALALGFKVQVITDGCRAAAPDTGKQAQQEMLEAGALADISCNVASN